MQKIKFIFLILITISANVFSQQLTFQEKLVFDDVVYITPKGSSKKIISKWTSPIIYQIKGDAPEAFVKEVDTTFSEFRKLTGLNIKKTTTDDEANFIIQVEMELHSKNIKTPGGGYMNYMGNFKHEANGKQEITRVENTIVILKRYSKSDVKYALKRMVLKSLGFFKKSEEREVSLFFSRTNSAIKIDKFDQNIIKFLYGNFVKPGMTKEEIDWHLNY
ncbi:MAG: DUF2927 domain-containing protein [Pedobacter sp.]|nr:MAG: DUF2927 domain-containing protein [Pedobacter sp.]